MSVTNLNLNGQGISLDSKVNQLQNVIVDRRSGGTVVIGNGNTAAADLNVSLGYTSESDVNEFDGSLTVHNYDNQLAGVVNKIVVNQILGATGNINLINDETDIDIASGAVITANNVLLKAENHNVNLTGGTITATTDTHSTAVPNGNVSLIGKNVVMAGDTSAVVTAANANITAGESITLTKGSLLAETAAMEATNGTITEADTGFVVDVADVTAIADRKSVV